MREGRQPPSRHRRACGSSPSPLPPFLLLMPALLSEPISASVPICRLMHESFGEGAARRLVVWKPSRSRRSLPAVLAANGLAEAAAAWAAGSGGTECSSANSWAGGSAADNKGGSQAGSSNPERLQRQHEQQPEQRKQCSEEEDEEAANYVAAADALARQLLRACH